MTSALPGGWSAADAADVVLSMQRRREDTDFTSNMIATLTRFPQPYDPIVSERAIDAAVAELDEVEVIERSVRVLGGREWSIVEVAFSDSKVGTLARLIAVTHEPAEDEVEILRWTGTCAAEFATEDLPSMRWALTQTEID